MIHLLRLRGHVLIQVTEDFDMKYPRRPQSNLRPISGPITGYTLTELLVVVVIIGVLSLALTSFLATQLFESLRFEKATRETDDASRIQHLLDTEISESDDVLYPGSLTLPSGCGAGNLVFGIDTPTEYDPTTSLPIYYRSYYMNDSSGGVYRCGKPVESTGALKFASNDVRSLVSANLSLNIVNAGSSAEALQYQLVSPNGRILLEGRAYGQAETIR